MRRVPGTDRGEKKGAQAGRDASASHVDLRTNFSPKGPTQEEAHRYLSNLPEVRFQRDLERKLQLSLGEIGVDNKICEKLFSKGVDTVGDLLGCSQKDILQIPSFGEKAVEHLLERLRSIGIFKGMGPGGDPSRGHKA